MNSVPHKTNLKTSFFHHPTFMLLWLGRFCATLATFMQSVTLGWQVYAIARTDHTVEQSAFLVGMVGLAQFLPLFALSFFAGETADRYDRRKILLFGTLAQILNAAALFILTWGDTPPLTHIFMLAGLFGCIRAFVSPANASMTPMLVPRVILPRALAWSSLAIQGGMIMGPWLGGLLCAQSTLHAYAAVCGFYVVALIAYALIRANTRPARQEGSRLELIRDGLKYVWSNKIVFGAISLDLFAVLLGGTTALLPVFARDVLHIGADGFGLLRGAPAMGSALTAIIISQRPIQRYAGRWFLGAVALFGVGTIIFALSENIYLSLLMLFILGAADGVSVYVRQTLVQIVTPDHMRGRVSAVSGLFISASNELGEFESGVMARLLGPIAATIFGGVGSIVITAIWAKLFPALRDADQLTVPEDGK